MSRSRLSVTSLAGVGITAAALLATPPASAQEENGLSNPSETGLELLGGGLEIHFGRILALGAEISYEGIAGTEFKTLGIGPSLHFGS